MQIPELYTKKTSPTNTVGDFVKWWNINFPLDRWYRKKYNIRWGSSKHKSINLLSMIFEYQEELLFNEVQRDLEVQNTDKYTIGDWYSPQSREQEIEDSKELFDNIDIDSITEDGGFYVD